MLAPFVFGRHERMRDLERRLGSIAGGGFPVLIEGASGTGKEALAELLHDANGMPAGFSRVACRRSEQLADRAAFMPAAGNSVGDGNLGDTYSRARGTLFLKGVHQLSPVAQVQLLAALEQTADSHAPQNAPTARLICSTTDSLEPLVSRGAWNAELYHRLSAYRICLPLLRERREDIPELFACMVRRAANGHAAPPPPATPRLLEALVEYDWPGNLRELQNIARTYVVTAHVEEIIAELRYRSCLAPLALPPPGDSQALKEQVKGASRKLESEIILRTLERHRWNRRRAAETLQISYRCLLYKMKNCNLRVETGLTPEGK